MKSNEMKSHEIKWNQMKSNEIKWNQMKSNRLLGKSYYPWFKLEMTFWIKNETRPLIACKRFDFLPPCNSLSQIFPKPKKREIQDLIWVHSLPSFLFHEPPLYWNWKNKNHESNSNNCLPDKSIIFDNMPGFISGRILEKLNSKQYFTNYPSHSLTFYLNDPSLTFYLNDPSFLFTNNNTPLPFFIQI